MPPPELAVIVLLTTTPPAVLKNLTALPVEGLSLPQTRQLTTVNGELSDMKIALPPARPVPLSVRLRVNVQASIKKPKP
jgi:hypothetical protein